MSRLIDADELKKRVCSYNPVKYTYEYGDVISVEDIDNAPTIDAEPVRHGKWIDDGITSHSRCSACDKEWYWFDNCMEDWNYCPNCGAKIDGAIREEHGEPNFPFD